VSSSQAQVSTARAQAQKLARSERRFLHVANTARLISSRLAAQKRAVLLGIRRHAADSRANGLQRRLDAATAQLGKYRDEAKSARSSGNSAAVLASSLFSTGGSSRTPYSGVVSIAMQYMGIPYTWGGASPTTGFDCSGLVQYVFAQVGIALPHYTVSQWNYAGAVPVPKNKLQPGDLVFFDGLGHVGIYIGYGDFIDAPHTGADVRIDSLSDSWFASRYDGARRILGAAVGGVSQAATARAFTSGGTAVGGTAVGGTTFSSDVVYFNG
jgi:cell wall-associated NlpC family hydrolase